MARHRPMPAMQLAIAVVLVLAFLPARCSRPLEWTGQLAANLIAPVSHPVATFGRWISPAARDADPEIVERLRDERDRFRWLFEREQATNQRLLEQIAQLQQGRTLNPDLPVLLRLAPVVGRSSDLSSGILRIRIGIEDGAHRNAVATVGGAQLVGRLVRVGPGSSELRILTDRAAGGVLGLIVTGEDGSGLRCSLKPTGAGTLEGPIEQLRGARSFDAVPVQAGMRVVLDDQTWPASSQRLTIGEVERVGQDPENPLRRIVTIRPTMQLDRVAEVVVRISESPADPAPVEGGP